MPKLSLFIPLLTLVLLAALVACGQTGMATNPAAGPATQAATSAPAPATTPTATPRPASPVGAASPAATGGNTVEVELSEFNIEMPRSIPAGMTTFRVTNVGTIPHNFQVEGQGINRVFDTNLQPGATETMEVELRPGTYQVYCPVGNHRQLGMQLELRVGQ